MLVPELCSSAAPELADLRAACDQATRAVLAARPDELIVVGSGPITKRYSSAFNASFAPWGFPLMVRVGAARHSQPPPAAGAPADGTDRGASIVRVPLSLIIGHWLLGRQSLDGVPVGAQSVDVTLDAAGCARLGARLAAGAGRVGLLVMGDGSACRGRTDPMPYDPRGEAIDDAAARALAGADPGGLLDLDVPLAADLGMTGRAPWQVLAGAAQATGGAWKGELYHEAAPFGVTYLVARWFR